MDAKVTLEAVCAPSENVVARGIEGDIVIVPLVSGVGDSDDELYTLNDTGRAIWEKLDGRRTLKEVAVLLADEFSSPLTELERDVVGFVGELARRGMLDATTR